MRKTTSAPVESSAASLANPRMTWKFPDEDPSQVSFTIESTAGSQILTVRHIGLTKEVGEYLTGWQTHLLYLEDFLNGTPRPMSDFWGEYERVKNAP